MARCYLDENVSEELGRLLDGLGHDALTTRAAGRKGDSDVRQLLAASRASRIWITYNTDDAQLLHEACVSLAAEWAVARLTFHPGILVLPQPPALTVLESTPVVDAVLRTDTLANLLLVLTTTGSWVEPWFELNNSPLERRGPRAPAPA